MLIRSSELSGGLGPRSFRAGRGLGALGRVGGALGRVGGALGRVGEALGRVGSSEL